MSYNAVYRNAWATVHCTIPNFLKQRQAIVFTVKYTFYTMAILTLKGCSEYKKNLNL